MNRIDRLSAILIMLQSNASIKANQIADRFNISTRTVYRDIIALEEAGIPIVNDKGRFSIIDGYKLPPLMFTEREAFAFLAAEKLVDQFSDSGFKDGYKSGIEKIKAVMRLSERKTVENIESKIASELFHPQDNDRHIDVLQTLMSEIIKRKKIKISYFSYNSQKLSNRIVDPIGIFFSLANWYLIAYCNDKKAYRTFRVSRIQNIELTLDFVNKEHPPLKNFLKQLSDNKNLKEVIIQVNKKDYLIIDESKYYQGLVSEIDIGDIIELHFMTFSIDRFARWLLSFIDVLKVISPIELSEKINMLIAKYCKIKI